MWETRCYFDGIPDDVPDSLLWSGRAPSWRSIALCILQNDLKLHKLGYTTVPGAHAKAVLDMAKVDVNELRLF